MQIRVCSAWCGSPAFCLRWPGRRGDESDALAEQLIFRSSTTLGFLARLQWGCSDPSEHLLETGTEGWPGLGPGWRQACSVLLSLFA